MEPKISQTADVHEKMFKMEIPGKLEIQFTLKKLNKWQNLNRFDDFIRKSVKCLF